MPDFAKLFNTEKYGQILVLKEVNEDEKPSIKVYFNPPGLGLCNLSIVFGDSEDGWENWEKSLDAIDEETAINQVKSAFETVSPLSKVLS